MYNYTKDCHSSKMHIIKNKELKCNQKELTEIFIKQNQRIEMY